MRKRFDLKCVVFVGDRGLLTSKRIDDEPRPAAWLDRMDALHSGPLQLSLLDEADLAELRHEDFPSDLLIARLYPLLREERQRKSEELQQSTEALIDPIIAPPRQPLRASRRSLRYMQRATLALHKHSIAKHFDLEVEEHRLANRRQDAIAAEQLLAAYVIWTSLPEH